ncbi:MAG: DNA cytosine methyltransferase [Bacteroidaceae bacterium]|nr:DNA cytosine methyltransferase [Bacteroidaceae bacterium]
MIQKKPTYISLFSSAGVGCYGFKMNGFRCIATNELLKTRIAVQRANHKCEYESGYVCGDITKEETKDLLFKEIDMWKECEGLEQVDVVFATPPCQGMSTVNYKKNDHEQIRNSLVVEAIKIIKQIHPKIFVFENVRAFLTSICTDINGEDIPIKESIIRNLSEEYNIYYKIVNFKDYGVPSSRPRTLVIGTSKHLPQISPLNLFPTRRREITLREAIGSFPSLKFGEKDTVDPLHFARPFPVHQIEWIEDLKEGQSAFDKPVEKQPYKIDQHGNRVILKGAYMGNKYRRLFWDKPGACVATRNDVLSSQDTIHPSDTRVLSIRELMRIMTIPDTFKWTTEDEDLTPQNSDAYLRKHEMNIRHCIGEAVPTEIMRCVAEKILAQLDRINTPCDSAVIKQQVSIFDEIMPYESSKADISIGVSRYLDFINYIPQLVSLFSSSEKIDIFAIGLSNEDQQQVLQFFNQSNLGDIIALHFVASTAGLELDFIITDVFKPYTGDDDQLSLF